MLKKNKFIQLLFLVLAFCCDAQIRKYHYDKEITFLSEADSLSGISVRFNSRDKLVPVYSTEYNSEQKSIRNTIDFYYAYRKNIYRMNGLLFRKKYADVQGFRTFSAKSPVRIFKKASDSLYDYKAHKNLEKRVSEDQDGTEIELFVANLNDQIDYSEPSLFFLSEHYGISPGLSKGEVVVYANYVFNKNRSAAVFANIKDISEDVYFNREQIEAVIDDRYSAFIAKLKTENRPAYCEVTAFGKDVDEKTREEMMDFLSHMCGYYELWGEEEKASDFISYYNDELQRRLAIYRRNRVLDAYQRNIYEKELRLLTSQNRAENPDYK